MKIKILINISYFEIDAKGKFPITLIRIKSLHNFMNNLTRLTRDSLDENISPN